jgi:hypothetical protein
MCGNYWNSSAHLQALRRLIHIAGGLEQFNYNDGLGRGVAWYLCAPLSRDIWLTIYRAEYHYAAAKRQISPLKYIPSIDVTFENDLLVEAAKTSPLSLLNIELYGSSIHSIFSRVQQLGLATSKPWASRADRVAISNTILETEYDMLLLSFELNPGDRDGAARRKANLDIVYIADALITSAQAFIFIALRTMPIGVRIVEIYLSRVRTALEEDRLHDVWRKHCSMEALLWTLFICTAAATGKVQRVYFLVELKRVCTVLLLTDREGMELVLRKFAWSDFFAPHSEIICKEIF